MIAVVDSKTKKHKKETEGDEGLVLPLSLFRYSLVRKTKKQFTFRLENVFARFDVLCFYEFSFLPLPLRFARSVVMKK